MRRCSRRWRTTACWCSPAWTSNPEAQVAFCRRLGEVDHSSDGHHPVAGIYPITLDKSKNSSADYLRATFDWHIDGCTPPEDECPQMATVLSAVQVAEHGGETEFASSYARLRRAERRREGAVRVAAGREDRNEAAVVAQLLLDVGPVAEHPQRRAEQFGGGLLARRRKGTWRCGPRRSTRASSHPGSAPWPDR